MNLQQGKNIVVFQDNNITILRASNRDINFTIDTADYEMEREGYDKLKDYRWRLMNTGYICATIRRQIVLLHIFIKGKQDGLVIDHINRNKLDNRKDNLRHIRQLHNTLNVGILKTNTSGFKGVSWVKEKKKYRCGVSVGNKNTSIGYFMSAQAAAIAYNNKLYDLHGAFAVLNELDEFDYMVALFD